MEQGGEVFIGDVQAAMAEARQSSYRSFPANSLAFQTTDGGLAKIADA